jgi:hypothetical protein
MVVQTESRQSVALRAGDFGLAAVRLVAFTPQLADFNPSAVLAVVLGKYAKRFDGDVQAIPLPEGVPPDIPRIELASSDGRWGFAASPSRITSLWNAKKADETADLNSVVTDCRGPIDHHVRENEIQVGRLGLVITRHCPIEHPAHVLVDRFCKDEVKDPTLPDAPRRNSRNFEIHNHKRYELPPGLTVNSWVRCRTGMVGKQAGAPAVTVEQDINTLAEEINERTFSTDDIALFLVTGTNEAEAILRKYFP